MQQTKILPVTKTYLPSFNEYVGQLDKIWQNGWITNNGLLVKELAEKLQAYLGVQNLELVANGTLALQIAIKALALKGEIITTPYSYVATTSAIMWEGCEPIFVDIEEKTFCIDADLIEAAITERTCAILATHVYGYPCNVDKLYSIARKHNLKIIYDAAHAFGVRLFGKSLVDCGDCSILSFHATKLFHSGEGGAVVCKNAQVNKRIFLMKQFGHIGEDNYLEVGINAKMSELHAAMGLCILPKVNEVIAQRKECSTWYDGEFDGSELKRPVAGSSLEYNYAYYPVIFSSHDVMMRVRQALLDNGIGPRRYFYPSLNTLPFLRQCRKQVCPISESVAERVLCLPLYVGLRKQEIDRVCKIVLEALKRM